MIRQCPITLRSSLLLKSAAAFLDQAILSGANFLVAFLLIKTVPTEQYGYYSIAFAVSLFLMSVQNAVVTTPLAVLLAAKDSGERHRYPAALFWGQLIGIIPTVLAGLTVTAMLYFFGMDVVQVSTICALCLAATGILVREFCRAYYFATESPFIVLALDSCYVATYLALMGLAFWFFRISVPWVFILMGLSGFLTSAVFTKGKWRLTLADIRASYIENWKFGKWALGGVLVTHVQSYCTLYLTGSLLGSAAAGNVAASRLPLSPLSLLQAGWGKVAIPRGARLRENGMLRRFLKEQAVFTGMLGLSITAYVALLLMSKDFLSKILFNRGYQGALDFIVFWGAINIVGFVSLNASIGLQVMKEFSIITKVNSVTMIVTLVSNYMLIHRYGIKGGLASSLLGETLLAIGLWVSLIVRYFEQAPTAENVGGWSVWRWPLLARKRMPL
jgi:O-antigen/teichoic acid export membrane protein